MTQAPIDRYFTVPELAQLLRIKERKVYDLAASGSVPCTRVTGKLLFPEAAVRRWLSEGQSGPDVANKQRPTVFLGSHDPLLDWALRHAGCGIATYFDSSRDGLTRFAKGEGIATALHLFDDASGEWNAPVVAREFGADNVALIAFARRRRGLVLRKGLGEKVQRIADLAGCSFVPRQPGAGTSIFFAHLARNDGLDLDRVALRDPALSEADAVLDVATGAADATFGLESLAAQHGLDFVPLAEERFDILVDRKACFDPQLQRFFDFLRHDAFADRARGFAGYDVSDAGRVVWNA